MIHDFSISLCAQSITWLSKRLHTFIATSFITDIGNNQ